MPQNKIQGLVFGVMMVIVMVYGMICYNISLAMGDVTNEIFIIAFKELIIMAPIAFIIEELFVGKFAKRKTFSIINPKKDNPFFIVLGISSITVLLMCPIMSFIATLLFHEINSQLFAIWVKTTALNFPMALLWQFFFAGPIVRFLFSKIFNQQKQQREPIKEVA